ncbi:MAG: hypothetical protein GEU76_12870 [Alphaproteobacteria bacterium]|nr:hypothetical protein [Alphaproteobacteria bacterium]
MESFSNVYNVLVMGPSATHCRTADYAKGRGEKLHERYVRRILEFAFLAPDITEITLDGRQPADLMLQEIVPDGALRLDWASQRRLLRLA